jgi:hypothetical protein
MVKIKQGAKRKAKAVKKKTTPKGAVSKFGLV